MIRLPAIFGVNIEKQGEKCMKQKQIEPKKQTWSSRRPQMVVWLGGLMGILSGILIAIVAVKLYMNETQRIEWSSQAVASRQLTEAGQTTESFYDLTHWTDVQRQKHGVRK